MRPLAQRPLLLLATTVLVASLVVSASAQRIGLKRDVPPGLPEANLVRKHAEELGLDEKTLKKLEAIVADVRPQQDELNEKQDKANKDLAALLDQQLPSEKALIETAGVIVQVGLEKRTLKLRCSLRVRALLTKEQLAKFMKLREDAFPGRRKRGGPQR